MKADQLRDLPLFEGLSNEDIEECAAMFQHTEMLAGSSLASEGDFAYKFFVVLDGDVEVFRNFEHVADLGPGDFFGEMGLMGGERRNARVTAKTRCDVAWMMAWDFKTMSERFPEITARIDAVVAERAATLPDGGNADYEPSTWDWVAEQVEAYEASGGTEANTLRDTGIPIIVMTCRGHKSGKVRKVPLMRVEHDGNYLIVASKGGAPAHPGWYYNLVADPNVQVQDGPAPFDARVRLIEGDERAVWWDRAVDVFSPYADYEIKAAEADRVIPVFLAEPS